MSDIENNGTETVENVTEPSEPVTAGAPGEAPSGEERIPDAVQPEPDVTRIPDDAQPEPPKKEKKRKGVIKIPLFAAVIAALAIAVLTAQITFLAVRQSYHTKLASINMSRFSDSKLREIEEIYKKYYINKIDEETLVDGLVRGYIFGTEDKYAFYMTAEEYAEYKKELNSEGEGIGVYATWDYDMSCVEILDVFEGSSAEEAGLLVGDRIIEVDGESIVGHNMDYTVAKIRGQSGTKVKIKILRGDKLDEMTFDIVRRAYESRTVRYKNIGNIAVISISNFYVQTPGELEAAVAKVTELGCDRIIFDVRNNSGGLYGSIEAILDYILPEGVTARITDANGNYEEMKSDAACLKMPMAVLVNGKTASAAELFTSALKDYDYATVIGTQTYGKGTVLTPFGLSDGSVVYVSTSLYSPPVSDNFEGKGVTPDVVVEESEKAKNTSLYKLALEDDEQLKKAVEIIKQK